MKLVYEGKTKDVFQLDHNHMILRFKDDVTGKDGVFDPGANTVGLTIDGMGMSGLRMSSYFFELLESKNIPTHFISSNIGEQTMTVKNATMFGSGLEVICRYKAVGSFYRRYGAYCNEGEDLNQFVEITLKDDERGDPPISKDALDMLQILSQEDYETLKTLTKQISSVVKEELINKGLELYDIKLEFGRDKESGDIMLIDEISGGNMRVYRNEELVAPMQIEKTLLA